MSHEDRRFPPSEAWYQFQDFTFEDGVIRPYMVEAHEDDQEVLELPEPRCPCSECGLRRDIVLPAHHSKRWRPLRKGA